MLWNTSYRPLLAYILPYRRRLLVAFLCTLGYVSTMPAIAYLIGQAAKLIGAGDLIGLIQWCAASSLLFVGRSFCQFGQDVLMSDISLRIVYDIRVRLYRHLHRLGVDYFEKAATGDLTYRLTEDVDRIGVMVNSSFHRLIPSTLTTVAVIGYMFYLNWQLTLGTMIIAPLMTFLIAWFGNRLLRQSRLSQARIADLASHLTEIFSGIRLIKAFAAEDYAVEQFEQQADMNRRARYRAERIKSMQYPVVGFLEALSIMLLFILGAWQINAGHLTGPQFLSFVAAVALLMEPINMISADYNELKMAQASVERSFGLLALEPTIKEMSHAQPLPPISGKVQYLDVCFGYDPERPVLKDFNLLAEPGEVIALVGHSGAGKSTIVNLLPRFYDPQAGKVLIDGIDIKTVTLKSLRRQIGIVPQETILFSGTIAHNIAFGYAEPDWERLIEAAKIANAHDFITQCPDGYQTWVGERGINLSGGQRQRLAIARAVYADPRILILDEATSALDSESEALVQSALEKAMKGRTVFIIAHRLATVRRADRILVLEQGQIIESGSHEELLARPSRYAQFYTQQYFQETE
ncbi:ABC transporter ATP-binding protein [Thermosynechococcus sp. JY1334]|uniref:ABC transporter ATP-binding protein n=1 Tax=unclassified Thermosynechococcus TaxID=2622553 RepID=UPI00122DDB1D|nr:MULTISPECIES: ABC transporter ATP-binding protein [unclassified Thermosynechococcus]MDR7898625.1 ABC transporter ATP-binding protein [Thermosynechococcus sp. JY1332]MDR7906029.1 ABC transporter ATP-binding protein [Thermosynechococcus sp. JY1334]QEQ00154.1 ABC transporter ATP-binding protein [Thermosynechococcus sp. CL-1]WKT85760.1 ABC transporter ATP-binding protein [Thermosynechococcus sp. JY1339]WNC54704.1 ABC transporter ATP-binding protein [Thermosynechococcus sp. JY1331]